MAKSQQTFNKSEKEKKRLKKREDKRKKMEAKELNLPMQITMDNSPIHRQIHL